MKLLGNNTSKKSAGQNILYNFGDPTPPILVPFHNENNVKHGQCKWTRWHMIVFLMSCTVVSVTFSFFFNRSATSYVISLPNSTTHATDVTPTTRATTMYTLAVSTDKYDEGSTGETWIPRTTEINTLATGSSSVLDLQSTPTSTTPNSNEITDNSNRTDDPILSTSMMSTTSVELDTTASSNYVANSTSTYSSIITTTSMNTASVEWSTSTQDSDASTSTEKIVLIPTPKQLLTEAANFSLVVYPCNYTMGQKPKPKSYQALLTITESTYNTSSTNTVYQPIAAFSRTSYNAPQAVSFYALEDYFGDILADYDNDGVWPREWAEWTKPRKNFTCTYKRHWK